jgi:hypothetical protein
MRSLTRAPHPRALQCARKLAAHNARRRERYAQRAAQRPPPPPPPAAAAPPPSARARAAAARRGSDDDSGSGSAAAAAADALSVALLASNAGGAASAFVADAAADTEAAALFGGHAELESHLAMCLCQEYGLLSYDMPLYDTSSSAAGALGAREPVPQQAHVPMPPPVVAQADDELGAWLDSLLHGGGLPPPAPLPPPQPQPQLPQPLPPVLLPLPPVPLPLLPFGAAVTPGFARPYDYGYGYAALPPAALSSFALKLPSESPSDFPACGLRGAAALAFGASYGGAHAAAHAPLLALEGCVVPGCTLLLLHALRDAAAAAAAAVPPQHDAAAAALAAALGAPCAGGAFLRARPACALASGGGSHATAAMGIVAPPDASTASQTLQQQQQQQRRRALPRVSPLAALSTAPVALQLLHPHTADALESPSSASASVSAMPATPPLFLRCLLHGQLLRFEGCIAADGAARADGDDGALALRACGGAEGAALLCDAGAPGGADAQDALLAAAAPPRVLLLTRDAGIVAEVGRTEAALLEAEAAEAAACERMGSGSESGSGSDLARDDVALRRAVVEGTLLALGHALRPGCAPALAARAAAGALAQGWLHAATRVMRAAAAEAAADAAPAAPRLLLALPRRVTLLHCAAAAGDAAACEAVLAAGSSDGDAFAFSAPHSVCATPCRATPLHAAAARGDAAGAAAAAALCGSAAGAAAWLSARDASGATPAALAAAGAAPALYAPLDAALRVRVAAGARIAAAAAAAVAAERGVFAPPHASAAAAALLRAPAAAAALSARGAHPDSLAIACALLLLHAPRRTHAAADPAADADAITSAGAHIDDDDACCSGPSSSAVAMVPPPPPLSYAAWLLDRQAWLVRSWALMSVAYHFIRVKQSWNAPPLADALAPLLASRVAASGSGSATLMLGSWAEEGLPLFHILIGGVAELAFELPASLLLVLPLLPRAPAAARAWLLRHAEALLLAEHTTHMIAAGMYEAWLLARAAPGVRVVWPLQVATLCAYATLLAHVCWPLRLRLAAPVIAARAALPLTATLWLHTPPRGVALQVSACAAAMALAVWREVTLRPRYERQRAAAAAAAAAAGARARDKAAADG